MLLSLARRARTPIDDFVNFTLPLRYELKRRTGHAFYAITYQLKIYCLHFGDSQCLQRARTRSPPPVRPLPSSSLPHSHPAAEPPADAARSPFKFNHALNSKVAIWCGIGPSAHHPSRACRNGEIARLQVSAIVNTTNETLDDRNSTTQSIFDLAGA